MVVIANSTTHCKKGHEYTPENTYWGWQAKYNRNVRNCRTCVRESGRRYKERQRQLRTEPPQECGSPIPPDEIHVTMNAIYFGRKKPSFKYASIYPDFDDNHVIEFAPERKYRRKHNYGVYQTNRKSDIYVGYVMQPIGVLRGGDLPVGVYKLKKKRLFGSIIYELTDKPLRKGVVVDDDYIERVTAGSIAVRRGHFVAA